MQLTLGTAWVVEAAFTTMVDEVHRAYPLETGGILLGYWAVPFTEVVITDVIGPGPDAMHCEDRFVPDAEYQERELARRYQEASQLYGYLGDWHSHPSGRDRPSWRDYRTLRVIAAYPEARAPVPVMGILSCDEGWTIRVWRYLPRARPWRRIKPLEVQLCDPPTRRAIG